jgi:hypothetical protein
MKPSILGSLLISLNRDGRIFWEKIAKIGMNTEWVDVV